MNLAVSIGILEAVKSENIGLGVVGENDSGKVNELNKLKSFKSNKFVKISWN
jgi:hypothetical protein